MRFLFFLGLIQAQHVWHQVNTSHRATCKISKPNEDDFYFVDTMNNTVTNFEAVNSFTFGLVLGKSVDFNMIYCLVCTRMDCKKQLCPRIMYVLSATGPASPHIDMLLFTNETVSGTWSNTGNLLQFLIFFQDVTFK
jgi:hypothetical protein